MRATFATTLVGFAGLAWSAGPPQPEGFKSTQSTILNGVDISYKEVPAEICGNNTSYAGYVNFPPNSMREVQQDYPAHMFWWYFEALEKPEQAPLIIWISGGPSISAMTGIFTGGGPCTIDDELKAQANPFSWTKNYNILFLDQPIHAGFSYDEPRPGYFDAFSGFETLKPDEEPPAENQTLFPGVFSSQDPSRAANTTKNAARQFWNFLQVWKHDFQAQRPHDDSIILWAESYGGHYGPAFATYIQEQNARAKDGSLPDAEPLNVRALSIFSGWIDASLQERAFSDFAYDRNTYDLRVIDDA